MAENEKNVSFGDKTVELNVLDRYKGRKGVTDRLAIVVKALLKGNSHWFNNRTFRCLTEDDKHPGICCEKLGAPMQKFGMVVFHYDTDAEGHIKDPNKCQGTLKIWILTESRYQELSNIHKQFPLLDGGFDKPQHDLTFACTEEQYQRATISAQPESHWKTKETWYQVLTQRVEKAKDRLALSVGKKLAESEVKEILGLNVPDKPPTQGPGDINLDDVLTSAAPTTTAPLAEVKPSENQQSPAPQAGPVPGDELFS